MLNIGPQELILILVVALVIVGPKKLPELARAIGRGMNEFRKIQDEVKDLVTFDLGVDLDDVAADPNPSESDVASAPATDEPPTVDVPHFTADLGTGPEPEPQPLPSVKAAERDAATDLAAGTDDASSSAAG